MPYTYLCDTCGKLHPSPLPPYIHYPAPSPTLLKNLKLYLECLENDPRPCEATVLQYVREKVYKLENS